MFLAILVDPDQAARMRRLIWVYAGRHHPKVHFRALRLILTKIKYLCLASDLSRRIAGHSFLITEQCLELKRLHDFAAIVKHEQPVHPSDQLRIYTVR